MGIVRRVIAAATGPSRPKVSVSASWCQIPTLAPGGDLPVVGESNYQRALERAGQGKNEDGCNVQVVTAELVREPGNRYDRNAVRVEIDGRTVGYIPADLAPSTHDAIRHLWQSGLAATCRARLTGGWDRGRRDQGSIGVVLDCAEPIDVFRPETAGALPEGARVSVVNEQHYQDRLAGLLGRASKTDVVTELVVVPADPHRKSSDPTVEVRYQGEPIGHLTAKMSTRYIPLLEQARQGQLPCTSRTRIAKGDNKIEAYVRLVRDPAILGR